jgi:hypothetical protein
MTAPPTPVGSAPSAWRRIALWLEQWAEALDFDISEHHERRIAQLERDVASLRTSHTGSSATTTAAQAIKKELA